MTADQTNLAYLACFAVGFIGGFTGGFRVAFMLLLNARKARGTKLRVAASDGELKEDFA
jgi:hypothetical protein